MKQLKHDPDQIAREIADKLGRSAGVSYTDIAKEAIHNGKTELAIKVGLMMINKSSKPLCF